MNEGKQTCQAEDKKSLSIIPPFAFDAQSTFWPSLLDVTSATLAPAQITTHTEDDEVTNVSTIGATVSPHLSHPVAIPHLRPQSSFDSSFLAVPMDSLPLAGSIGHIFNTNDENPSNAPTTRTTASPQLAQLTTERRVSPPNTRPFHLLSLPIVSLDDLSSAEFIGHSPDNGDRDAENVPTAEATVSSQTGSDLIYIRELRITDNHAARFLELPNELLYEIMAFLLSIEPLYAPTHLRLLAPRHVCRRLRNAAEKEIRKTLNASHGHFDTRGNVELRRWFKGRAEPQELRHAVSLQVDVDTRHSLDKDLLKDFVSALPNCRQARVEIQGTGGLFGKPFGTLAITTVPPSHIHSFSWISATLGIRDPIPLDNFPWHVLANHLPWSQLTHLSLDCPLSDLDAYGVLSKGQTTLESVSLKLTERKKNLLGVPVPLPSLRSLTIDTRVPVRDLLSKLSLSALEKLDLKSRVCAREDSPLLNQHLNVPWGQLRSLSLSNEDTRERRSCPVTAILTECHQLQQFKWQGPSDTFETWTSVLSFRMSQQLQELIVKSDPQGCKLLLEKLLYRGNIIRRVNISHLDLDNSSRTLAYLPHWTHITVSEGVTLSNLSKILTIGKGLTKAAFLIFEGGTPLTSRISSKIQELELCTNIRIPSLWEWLDSIAIQSVKISFGGMVFNHSQVLDDMAPFLQRYPNLPSPLISAIHSYSPYDLLRFDEN
jgi:hypothetical protein